MSLSRNRFDNVKHQIFNMTNNLSLSKKVVTDYDIK